MEHENRWDGEEIAGRVRDVVQDVMESLELGRWNQAVRDTAGAALEEARRQMEQYRRKAEDARWRGQTVGENTENLRQEAKPLEIRVSWRGRVSGILFTVFGSVGSAVFGLPALGLLAAMTTSDLSPIGWWIAGGCGALAVGFGGMLWTGISQNRRIGRLKRYVAELKRHGRSYCELEELSRSCARTTGFVRKDIKKMIGLGMLPDVRIDKKGSWLLLDDETYRQFQLFEKARDREAEEGAESQGLRGWLKGIGKSRERKKEKEQARESGGDRRDIREEGGGETRGDMADGPLDAAVRQGEQYMSTLRRLRESMPGDPVDARLLRLETVLGHLFGTLKKHPEQMDEMERFMEYYLPTTVKLAESYREFAAVEFPGENIRQAREKILGTLDTINKAFEGLQDDLYQDAAFDAMTDASVLRTMLERDGMAEPDFQKTTPKG